MARPVGRKRVSPTTAWVTVVGVVVVVALVFLYVFVWRPLAQREARQEKFFKRLGVKTEEEAMRLFLPRPPSPELKEHIRQLQQLSPAQLQEHIRQLRQQRQQQAAPGNAPGR